MLFFFGRRLYPAWVAGKCRLKSAPQQWPLNLEKESLFRNSFGSFSNGYHYSGKIYNHSVLRQGMKLCIANLIPYKPNKFKSVAGMIYKVDKYTK